MPKQKVSAKARQTLKAVSGDRPPGMAGRSGAESPDVKAYQQLTQAISPRRPLFRNVLAAFVVGGLICVIGQAAWSFWEARGWDARDAAGLASATMVVLAAILTGIGVYDEIGDFGGMGSAIPITGFANSIVSPALEFKREGFILGVGARLFQVAGPVIVYGTFVSMIVAAVKLLLGGL